MKTVPSGKLINESFAEKETEDPTTGADFPLALGAGDKIDAQ